MTGNSRSTPVLMYHAVGNPKDVKQFLCVPGLAFERQIRLLLTLGYQPRAFTEVTDSIRTGKSLSRRNFAITFDDSYCSVGEIAAPILKTYSVLATTFVVSTWSSNSDLIGLENGRLPHPVMQRGELLVLHSAGWEIGGHTRTHLQLDELNDTAALNEISAGKEETEEMLGVSLKAFCYPYGYVNERTPGLARIAGFTGACTVRSGIASPHSDPFLIPRVKIGSRDGAFGMLYRILVRPALPTFRRNRRSHRIPVKSL